MMYLNIDKKLNSASGDLSILVLLGP